MGNPASNPTPSSSRSAYPGGGVKSNASQKKRAGSKQRPSIPATGTPSSGQRTAGRSVTVSAAGTEGGLPLGQQASPGRQGLPPSSYNAPSPTKPIPNKGS
jgi:hypothetical protein